MTKPTEPLRDLKSSRLMVLDFSQIPDSLPKDESIENYFKVCAKKGIDPKPPENRQKFNNYLLDKYKVRYLISRYKEDRSAMLVGSSIYKEGRTYHLGVDIFSKDLEDVYAPFDGEIVVAGVEPESHSFGNYLILKADDKTIPYMFFGHLSNDSKTLGRVKAGQRIGQVGDYVNSENGTWSRHLHVQMLSELPKDNGAPVGYSSLDKLEENSKLFPDPLVYLPDVSLSA